MYGRRKNMISPVLIKDGQSITVHVCPVLGWRSRSDFKGWPPLKFKVDQAVAVQKPAKKRFVGSKTLITLFYGTPYFFLFEPD